MTDTEKYIKRLLLTNPLREPVIRRAIRILELPKGSFGLDAGCGIGLQTRLLSETVGHSGQVIGLDCSRDFLNQANKIVNRSEKSRKITFLEGNIQNLPFKNDVFDWIWSSDCVGYAPLEPMVFLKEMTRVVKPNGKLILLAWSSQQLLPGYPLLESRLNATPAGIAPFIDGEKPERHFNKATGWLKKMDLQDIQANTLAGTAHAPLKDDIRTALTLLIQMRWENAHPYVSENDWQHFLQISNPESSDFILNAPDYYGFFTYSIFSGRVGVAMER